MVRLAAEIDKDEVEEASLGVAREDEEAVSEVIEELVKVVKDKYRHTSSRGS